MMSVTIFVNNQPIYTRTAHRINVKGENNFNCYELDDGSRIWHDPKKGIVSLAKKALDTIEPVGAKQF